MEVRPNAGQLNLGRNSRGLENILPTNPAPLKHLRRVQRPGRHDHFLPGLDRPRTIARHFTVARREQHTRGVPDAVIAFLKNNLRDTVARQQVEVIAVGGAALGVVVADLGVGARAGGRVDRVGAPEDADGMAICALDGELDAVDRLEGVPDRLCKARIVSDYPFRPDGLRRCKGTI